MTERPAGAGIADRDARQRWIAPAPYAADTNGTVAASASPAITGRRTSSASASGSVTSSQTIDAMAAATSATSAIGGAIDGQSAALAMRGGWRVKAIEQPVVHARTSRAAQIVRTT